MTQVKGLKELADFMHQLPDKLQKNVMRGALRAGAKVIEAQAIANVPVDKGDLKKSIRVSTRSRRGEITASVKTDLYYAKFVEFGTSAHWIRIREDAQPARMTRRGSRKISLKTLNKAMARGSLRIGEHFVGAAVAHPGATAHPFLRPALDTKATEAVVAVGSYIQARLSSKHGMDTSGINVEAEEA
jgi:HK97 gp10 family phage protein